ncbi:MAG: ABC transporter ATP-binding protein [Alphaproteobacteria bacterium]|nr:ABC transporter ATP-binding protein [Alphaproteobacteria bacterium]
MLAVERLEGGYGTGRVLQGVTFTAPRGAVTAIVGRNGMGKTTTLRAVMGMLPAVTGAVAVGGRAILGLPVHEVARAGVAYVPEGRQIFPKLTVAENLQVGQRVPSRLWPQDRIFALMPNLRERLGNDGRTLSGGEQQMLAIARALVTDPAVLLLDEPSQGLAPLIVQQLAGIVRRLREVDVAVVLVEQNLGLARAVADQMLVMVKGEVVYAASAERFREEEASVRAQWLTP